MGHGIRLKCSKCTKEYTAYTGVGFELIQNYEKIVKEIENGIYGEEMKNKFLSEKYCTVDCEYFVYKCTSCNQWRVEEKLSIYAPNDPEIIEKKKYGRKTVKRLGKVPYVLKYMLEEDYHLLYSYEHRCEKCGAVMQEIDSEIEELPCPYCGEEPSSDEPERYLWD